MDAVRPLEQRFIEENEQRGLPAAAFVREAKARAAIYADLILVMEGGRIVEQGAREALLRANGAYAALYNTQFAAAAMA